MVVVVNITLRPFALELWFPMTSHLLRDAFVDVEPVYEAVLNGLGDTHPSGACVMVPKCMGDLVTMLVELFIHGILQSFRQNRPALCLFLRSVVSFLTFVHDFLLILFVRLVGEVFMQGRVH